MKGYNSLVIKLRSNFSPMHSLRISIGAALALSLMAVTFAFADDDRNNSGKGKGNGKKDEKAFSFSLPFTSLGTTTGALQAQIQSLQEMLKNLKAQREALDDDSDDSDDDSDDSNKAARDALKTEIKQTKNEIKFLRSLSRGMRGDDVRDLQELLAQDPSILTSDNITGFFGPLTEEALRKFQRKHGIDAIGVFGPKTQAKILSLFVGKTLPPGIIARLGLETSSTTPGQGFVTLCHKPVGTSPQTLVIAIPALGAHLAHGDSVGVCPGSGATTTPPTDTTAPLISALSVTPASTTAQVNWTTNENSSSRVWYGTTSPLTLASPTTSIFNSSLVLAHSLSLSGLTASTTYYLVVESKDATGNTATSSSATFVTSN